MFHWLADWVLLAIAVSRRDLSRAENNALALLDPNSLFQPVKEPVVDRLGEALRACQEQKGEAAFQLFNQALELAKAYGDL